MQDAKYIKGTLKRLISDEMKYLLEKSKSDDDLLFELAGFYGSIVNNINK